MGLTRSCGLLRKMGMEVRVRTPHKFEFSQLEDPDQGFSIQHKRKDSFNALFEDRLAPMRIDTFLAYMASLSFSVCVMTPYVVRCCYCCLLCICPDPPGCSHCVQELMLIGLSYLFIYLFIYHLFIYFFIYLLFIHLFIHLLSIYSSIYSFIILDHLSIIHLSLIYFYYWRSRLWGRLLFWHVGQPSFLAGTWAAFFIWEVGCLFGRGIRLSFWQDFFFRVWWYCVHLVGLQWRSVAMCHCPNQGWESIHRLHLWVWAQPMRDDVKVQCRLSLAEPIPRMISAFLGHSPGAMSRSQVFAAHLEFGHTYGCPVFK